MVAKVLARVGTLARHPEMGKVSVEMEREYRELIVDKYRIFYRIEGEQVWIVRVWDSRRDPDEFFIP